MRMPACFSVCLPVCLHVPMCVCTYAPMHLSTYVPMYVCLYCLSYMHCMCWWWFLKVGWIPKSQVSIETSNPSLAAKFCGSWVHTVLIRAISKWLWGLLSPKTANSSKGASKQHKALKSLVVANLLFPCMGHVGMQNAQVSEPELRKALRQAGEDHPYHPRLPSPLGLTKPPKHCKAWSSCW